MPIVMVKSGARSKTIDITRYGWALAKQILLTVKPGKCPKSSQARKIAYDSIRSINSQLNSEG